MLAAEPVAAKTDRALAAAAAGLAIPGCADLISTGEWNARGVLSEIRFNKRFYNRSYARRADGIDALAQAPLGAGEMGPITFFRKFYDDNHLLHEVAHLTGRMGEHSAAGASADALLELDLFEKGVRPQPDPEPDPKPGDDGGGSGGGGGVPPSGADPVGADVRPPLPRPGTEQASRASASRAASARTALRVCTFRHRMTRPSTPQPGAEGRPGDEDPFPGGDACSENDIDEGRCDLPA